MFENDPRGIIVPVRIGDDLTARMSFDTGAYMDCFELDSAFAANKHLELWAGPPDKLHAVVSSTWIYSPVRQLAIYEKRIGVNIAGMEIEYPFFGIRDMMSDFSADIDGMFNFPGGDTTHVWELNFENDYLEIHDAAAFRMPEDCHLFPLITGYNYPYIRFPLTITTSDGEQITIDEDYLIDTGALMDFAIVNPAPALDFFRRKEASALISHGNGFRSRYDVSATVFGDRAIDSMRIYTIEDAPMDMNYVIGLNFLKRFNVFFDLSTQTVGLQPIDSFKRIIDPNARRFYFSSRFTSDGRQFVDKVTPFKNNWYLEAGLRASDEIVAINGFSVQGLTPENALKIRDNNTKILDIIRDGASMTLTVNIDSNDLQGE